MSALIRSIENIDGSWPLLARCIEALVVNLNEPEVFVTMVDRQYPNELELQFEYNRAIFRIRNISEVGRAVSLRISLWVDDRELWVWETTTDLNSFGISTRNLALEGFPIKGTRDVFNWYDGARPRVEIKLYGEDMDSFFSQSGKPAFDGVSEPTIDTEVSETPKQRARQPSIVPEALGNIRVVALKYQGEVIAFRFKTDVGAFDMRKAVAATYGLGGFKAETFITLESVNGLLMSRSEKQKQRCVPDISDCTEDCCRLMRALFGD